ncbi:uncharacterized protein ACIB01_005410 [Guaruba guarouba]
MGGEPALLSHSDCEEEAMRDNGFLYACASNSQAPRADSVQQGLPSPPRLGRNRDASVTAPLLRSSTPAPRRAQLKRNHGARKPTAPTHSAGQQRYPAAASGLPIPAGSCQGLPSGGQGTGGARQGRGVRDSGPRPATLPLRGSGSLSLGTGPVSPCRGSLWVRRERSPADTSRPGGHVLSERAGSPLPPSPLGERGTAAARSPTRPRRPPRPHHAPCGPAPAPLPAGSPRLRSRRRQRCGTPAPWVRSGCSQRPLPLRRSAGCPRRQRPRSSGAAGGRPRLQAGQQEGEGAPLPPPGRAAGRGGHTAASFSPGPAPGEAAGPAAALGRTPQTFYKTSSKKTPSFYLKTMEKPAQITGFCPFPPLPTGCSPTMPLPSSAPHSL